jgi:ABC-2 type transport system permease protein
MYAKLQTWWTILRICLEERLVYRADFAMGTLMRFLPIITQIFLWFAVFEASGKEELAGYRYEAFVAYYLLTMISRAFSSMPGLASGIARQVREGEIKKYLIQPVDMLGFLLLARIAHKLAYYAVAIAPFALVFFLCRNYFVDLPATAATHSIVTALAFVASLLLSFILGFFLEATLGLMGFWFLEVSSLLFVYMLFNFFLSGHMFPLDMLNEPWHSLVAWSPLQYLAYFPAAVFLGKYESESLGRALLLEVCWVLFFMVAARVLLQRGIRQYSGYGG